MSPSPKTDSSSAKKIIASLTISAGIVGLAIVLVLVLSPGDLPQQAGGPEGRGDGNPLDAAESGTETPEGVAVAGTEDAKDDTADNGAPEMELLPLLRGIVTGEGSPVSEASVLLFSVRDVEKTINRIERLLPQGELPDIEELISRVKGELERFKDSARIATTAEDGTYEFRGIEPTGYLVLTVADEWMFRYGDVVSLAEGRTEELNMDLSPGEAISGRVVSDAGVGIAGTEVLAEFRPPGMPGIGRIVRRLLRFVNGEFLKGPFEVRTEEDGSFTIGGLPPGVYDLAVSRTDGLVTRLSGVETGTSGVIIHLGRAAAARGYLADLSGAAAAGVRIVSERQEELIQLPLPAAGFNKMANTIAKLLGEPARRFRSGKDGQFLLAPLAPGRYMLSVDEKGYLPMQRSFEVEWGQDVDLGTLRLDRGEGITGVVYSVDGSPIDGARVFASPVQINFLNMGNSANDFLSGRTTAITDTAGAFLLSGLPRGQYRLIATARGHAAGWTSDAMTGGEPVTIQLQPGKLVTGRVIDETTREPIEGARVRAGDIPTDTDEDGRFSLEGVAARNRGMGPFGGGPMRPESTPTATVSVQARARGYLEGRGSVDLAAGDTEVVIELSPAPVIAGQVLDPDGQPAPGSLVRLAPWVPEDIPPAFDFLEKGMIFLAVGVTDLEGKFQLTDFPGGNAGLQYRILADHVVYARGASEPFRLGGSPAEGEGTPEEPVPEEGPAPTLTAGVKIEVRLQEATAIRGVVTDGSQPVPRATVRLTKARPQSEEGGQMAMVMNILGLPKGGDMAYTNQEGRFAYERLIPGTYSIQAEVRGFRDSDPREVTVEAGDEQEVNLVVDPGGEIRGVVVDTQGTALSGARVRLLREPDEDDSEGRRMLEAQRFLGGSYKSVRSDDEGAFIFSGLPEASYTLVGEKRGYTRQEVSGRVPGGNEESIVLAAAATLTGTVLDSATGEPITQFIVKATREGEAGGRYPFSRGTRPYSDGDGRFSRSDLQEGVYKVEVSSSGYLPAMADLALVAGESVDRDFFLARAGTIRGTVYDLATGRPIQGARIGLTESRSQSASESDDGGGSRREARIARTEGAEGEAPASATPEQEDERAMGEFFSSRFGGLAAESREDGSYILEGVPDGTRRVIVSHPDFISESRDGIRVGSGEELALDVPLKAGLEISGRILDQLGEIAAGQWVFIRGTSKENSWVRKTANTNPQGEFRVGGLAQGTYRLVISPRGGRGGNRTVREIILDGNQRGMEITLE